MASSVSLSAEEETAATVLVLVNEPFCSLMNFKQTVSANGMSNVLF